MFHVFLAFQEAEKSTDVDQPTPSMDDSRHCNAVDLGHHLQPSPAGVVMSPTLSDHMQSPSEPCDLSQHHLQASTLQSHEELNHHHHPHQEVYHEVVVQQDEPRHHRPALYHEVESSSRKIASYEIPYGMCDGKCGCRNCPVKGLTLEYRHYPLRVHPNEEDHRLMNLTSHHERERKSDGLDNRLSATHQDSAAMNPEPEGYYDSAKRTLPSRPRGSLSSQKTSYENPKIFIHPLRHNVCRSLGHVGDEYHPYFGRHADPDSAHSTGGQSLPKFDDIQVQARSSLALENGYVDVPKLGTTINNWHYTRTSENREMAECEKSKMDLYPSSNYSRGPERREFNSPFESCQRSPDTYGATDRASPQLPLNLRQRVSDS